MTNSNIDHTRAAVSARLTVLEGFSQGVVFLVGDFPTVVGRGAEADILLEDDPNAPTISRAHLRLALASGRLTVEDLSTNGTSIENRLLRPGEEVLLGQQETVWLGPRTALLVETVRARPTQEAPETSPMPDRPAIPLELVTLGPWSVQVGGRTLDQNQWAHRKAFLLMVYLAGASPHSVPVVRLWEVFWPDNPESGRQGLQTAVSRLRRCFRQLSPETSLPNPVLFRDQAYSLDPTYEPQLDALVFEQCCSAGRHARSAGNLESAEQMWHRAVGLYRRDFLEGFSEDWVDRRRVQLRRELLETLAGLAHLSCDAEEALQMYRRGLELEPGWEAGHLGLLRCLVQLERRHEAVFHYQECERTLRRLYGQTPSPHLLRFYHTELSSQA